MLEGDPGELVDPRWKARLFEKDGKRGCPGARRNGSDRPSDAQYVRPLQHCQRGRPPPTPFPRYCSVLALDPLPPPG
jgi:hypothetical protein